MCRNPRGYSEATTKISFLPRWYNLNSINYKNGSVSKRWKFFCDLVRKSEGGFADEVDISGSSTHTHTHPCLALRLSFAVSCRFPSSAFTAFFMCCTVNHSILLYNFHTRMFEVNVNDFDTCNYHGTNRSLLVNRACHTSASASKLSHTPNGDCNVVQPSGWSKCWWNSG